MQVILNDKVGKVNNENTKRKRMDEEETQRMG